MADARPTTELPDKMPTLRVIPMPADANQSGDIFGGWIMAQVDLAGAVAANRVANGRVATIAVNSFVFKQPVFVGDMISLYAEVLRVGRTSITASVEVYAQHRSDAATAVKVTEAVLTYVAVDENGRPRVVSVQQ
jgi:acyl-CoA thioesterase YciA